MLFLTLFFEVEAYMLIFFFKRSSYSHHFFSLT